MSTPTSFDVVRETSGGNLYRAVKPASGEELGAPWVRLTSEQYAAEVATQAAPIRSATKWAFWKATRQLHPAITRSAVRALLPVLIQDAGALEDALIDFDEASSVQSNNALIPLVQGYYELTNAQVTAIFDLADTFIAS